MATCPLDAARRLRSGPACCSSPSPWPDMAVEAQTVTPASTRAACSGCIRPARAAWTLKTQQDIRWQQVTPAGTLLISTDAALMGVDIERGQVTWEKPELGGLAGRQRPDAVEGSLLMEAARPGLLLIFDPVTGAAVFDSRRLGLAEVVTRRVLPQTGTILIHGRRPPGPPVVALYDLATGDQRWVKRNPLRADRAQEERARRPGPGAGAPRLRRPPSSRSCRPGPR